MLDPTFPYAEEAEKTNEGFAFPSIEETKETDTEETKAKEILDVVTHFCFNLIFLVQPTSGEVGSSDSNLKPIHRTTDPNELLLGIS